MRNKAVMLIASVAAGVAMADPTVKLDWNAPKKEVSKDLWGIFFEDINWAADGGLNPELLANGGFDWQQNDHEKWNRQQDGWEPDFRDGGMARLSFQYGAPVHPNTAKHLRIESFGKGLAGVKNTGLDGMKLVKGEPYRLVYDVRELTEQDGIDWRLPAWARRVFEFTFEGERTFEEDGVKIVVGETAFSILVSGRRVVEFDNVSLLPTGPNLVRAGMRKDLVDRLADLKPAFVRFPGGCIVEEGDFQHWYDWRRTVGPKERRECIWNRWGSERIGDMKPYWETFHIGFYEYFILCEELGAEPLPICLSGLTCQFQRPSLMCAVEDVDYFANVILELIEFANGATDTKWGAVRAAMGHPKPFNLKMVGVGNENWDAPFFDRCEPIARIIRAKHPEIKIVGSSGPGPDDGHYKYAWSRLSKECADIVDEHYYRDPAWFINSFRRYDGYDRAKLPVYAGEYACHHHVDKAKPNTQWSAVCEAVAMCGFERNADVVRMASYAPLFARVGHYQWSPNLIWFDGEKSWATPNYHVQRMFSLNRPDYTVGSSVEGEEKEHLFTSCGADREAGEIVLKLVNVEDGARKVVVELGVAAPKGEVKVTSLSAGRVAVNKPESPDAVAPVESSLAFEGGDRLSLDLGANSVTVVRIPAKGL